MLNLSKVWLRGKGIGFDVSTALLGHTLIVGSNATKHYTTMNIEETIDFAKNSIEGLFNNQLDIKTYGYLLADLDLKDNYQYEIKGDNFIWKQISEISERTDDWWTYYVLLKLDFNGNIIVKESNKTITEKNKKFDLFVDLWFKTDRIEYTYRLLDKK